MVDRFTFLIRASCENKHSPEQLVDISDEYILKITCEQRVVWSWKGCTPIIDFTNLAIAGHASHEVGAAWKMDHAAPCKIHP